MFIDTLIREMTSLKCVCGFCYTMVFFRRIILYIPKFLFFKHFEHHIQYTYNAHIHLSTAKCRRNSFNCQFVFWDSFQETVTSERTFNNPRYAWY